MPRFHPFIRASKEDSLRNDAADKLFMKTFWSPFEEEDVNFKNSVPSPPSSSPSTSPPIRKSKRNIEAREAKEAAAAGRPSCKRARFTSWKEASVASFKNEIAGPNAKKRKNSDYDESAGPSAKKANKDSKKGPEFKYGRVSNDYNWLNDDNLSLTTRIMIEKEANLNIIEKHPIQEMPNKLQWNTVPVKPIPIDGSTTLVSYLESFTVSDNEVAEVQEIITPPSTPTKEDKVKKMCNKPFKCTKCPKSFNDRSNLRAHERKKNHNDWKFQCLKCTKSFGTQKYLDKHTMTACIKYAKEHSVNVKSSK